MTTIERAGWLDLAVDPVEAERVLGVEQPGGDLLDAGLRDHVGHLGAVVHSPAKRTHQT